MGAPAIEGGSVETFTSPDETPSNSHTVPFPSGTVDGDLVIIAAAYWKIAIPTFDFDPVTDNFLGFNTYTAYIGLWEVSGGATDVTFDISSPATPLASFAAVTCRLTPPPPGRTYARDGSGNDQPSSGSDFTFNPTLIDPDFDTFWVGFFDGSEDVLFLQVMCLTGETEDGENTDLPTTPSGWSLVGSDEALHLVIPAVPDVQTIRCALYETTATGEGPSATRQFPSTTVGTPQHVGEGSGFFYPWLTIGAYWGEAAQVVT